MLKRFFLFLVEEALDVVISLVALIGVIAIINVAAGNLLITVPALVLFVMLLLRVVFKWARRPPGHEIDDQ